MAKWRHECMRYEQIIYEKEGDIAVITFNRPSVRNSLSMEMITELMQAMDHIESDGEIKAVIVTGGKQYFSAGFDLKQLAQHEGKSKAALLKIVDQMRLFEKRLEYCKLPVIAAICGPCLAGGFEIALSCDLRVASDSSIFGLPEIRFGAFGMAGATQRLPRMIPVGLAKELHFMGEPISAQEAYRIGLVNKIFSLEVVLDEAKKMAHKMTSYSSAGIKMCKFLINSGMKMDVTTAMDCETELARYLVEAPEFEDAKRKATEREGLYANIFRQTEKQQGK